MITLHRLRARVRVTALLVVAASVAAAPGLAQQQGPIRLFPELGAPGAERADRPATRPGGQRDADAPRAFQVEGLEAPEVDDIGLGEAGFGPELWQGSDGEVVLALLAGLPPALGNPPLRHLTRRLLVTGVPLDGPWDPGMLLEARVERLVAMGDLAAAGALLGQLPPSGADSALLRQAARVALWADNNDQACALTDSVAPGSAAPFWQQLVVFCRLREGDTDGANLALGLLREAGVSDDGFFRLAEMIANDDLERGPPPIVDPSPLHVAILRLGELPAPQAALREPSPPLVAAIARTPSLAPGRELEFAERALEIGVLSEQELTARYLERVPEDGGDTDILTLIDTDWGPETRALAYQRLLDEPDAGVRAEILDALWQAAGGGGRLVVAPAFARPYAELEVQNGLVFAAESMAGALLAGGNGLAAARWFNLLQTSGARNREAAAGAARLAPLFALAGFGGSAAVPEPDAQMLSAWWANTPNAGARASSLYALLDGVGAPVPETAWWEPIVALGSRDRPLEETTALPAAPLWRSLERAQSANRRGDIILLALHMLDGEPSAAWPEAVVAGLRGLRQAGQEREARDIAVAAALAHELQGS